MKVERFVEGSADSELLEYRTDGLTLSIGGKTLRRGDGMERSWHQFQSVMQTIDVYLKRGKKVVEFEFQPSETKLEKLDNGRLTIGTLAPVVPAR